MQKFASTGGLKKIQFVTPTIGWAVGRSTVFKSVDGGEQWKEQQINIDYPQITSCYFVDSSIGWIAGIAGVESVSTLICKTTDGGTSWVRQTISSWEIPHSVFFINADTGWVIGDDEMIYRTNDGGVHWNEQHHGDAPSAALNSVWFVDKNNGWAVGEGIILKTSDGGKNWSSRMICDKTLNAVRFIDASTGWVVGWYGVILKTIDGGSTSAKTNFEIHSTNNFRLVQNYPNPFNPTTTISYQIPVSSHVILKIFDILGREVATLMNQRKDAGRYSVQWDATRFPSGVYFNTLQAGEYRDTKRMMLLK